MKYTNMRQKVNIRRKIILTSTPVKTMKTIHIF